MAVWLIFGAIAVITILWLIQPLVRPDVRIAGARFEYDLEVYKDQLEEIERDLTRGLLEASEAEAARGEVERRMLAAADVAESEQGGGSKGTETSTISASEGKQRKVLAIVLACLLPAFAGLIYLEMGRPDLPGQPLAQRADVAAYRKVMARVRALEARARKEPAKIGNWLALGRINSRLRRYKQAAAAYRRAWRISAGHPGIAVAYGEALTRANRNRIPKLARAAFEAAIKRQPGNPRARYFLGLADAQAGKFKSALKRWIELDADAPANAPYRKHLRSQIDRTAKQAKIDASAYRKQVLKDYKGIAQPTPKPGEKKPGSADIPTIRAMVARLAARLEKQPKDLKGWLMLGRSYMVLKEPGKAAKAFSRAAALKPGDAAILEKYVFALLEANKGGKTMPPELVAALEKLNAADPKHVIALYFLGELAARKGDKAKALKHWRALLKRLPKNARLRARIEAGIKTLEK